MISLCLSFSSGTGQESGGMSDVIPDPGHGLLLARASLRSAQSQGQLGVSPCHWPHIVSGRCDHIWAGNSLLTRHWDMTLGPGYSWVLERTSFPFFANNEALCGH